MNRAMIKLHACMSPLVRLAGKKYIKQKLNIDNLLSYEGAAIYAVNHTNVADTPVVFQTLKRHTFILAGTNSQKLIDSIGFAINGTVWVDRQSPESRQKSKKKIFSLLTMGVSIIWFPEGTWNLSENLLMLPMRWGIVDMAKKAEIPIIPIAIYYGDKYWYSKVGEPIHINADEENSAAIVKLRDILATMRYEQMEAYGKVRRKDVSREMFRGQIKKSLDEYTAFKRDYEESCVYKNY